MPKLNIENMVIAQEENLLSKAMERNNGYTMLFIKDIKMMSNPRKIFNEESIDELANSIKAEGLIQPVVVDYNNNLISGERRIRACKKLGHKKINVVRKKNSSSILIVQLLENIQREDLSIIDLAESFIKLKNDFGWKQTEIAKHLNKSKQWVTNIISGYKNLKEDSELGKEYTALYSKGKKIGVNKINKKKTPSNEEQFAFNFRWTLPEKVMTDLNEKELRKLSSMVSKMNGLKDEINTFMMNYKNRKKKK